MIKLGLIRGDFANPWELQNFYPLKREVDVTVFTGFCPISPIGKELKSLRLLSPVDINFGRINKYEMAILNRAFSDAHILFGLENSLKGYDIAHCAETYFGYTAQAIKAKLDRKVKHVVSTVWENIPFNNESLKGKLVNKELSKKNVDLFVAVTSGAKKALEEEGFKKDNIVVLGPGVNLNHFNISKRANKFRNFVKRGQVVSLFVGRLEKEKGLEDLLNIYGKLIKNSDTHLIIVGEGSLGNWIRERILSTKNNNIHLLDKVPYAQMPDIYRSADFLIHPAFGSKSWQEQYGMSMIEAMACGLPVVGANSGSIPEIVGNAGIVLAKNKIFDEAFLFSKNKTKIKKFSILAQKRSKLKFDSSKYSDKLLELYKNLLKHK